MSEPDWDEFDWPEVVADCDECGVTVVPDDPDVKIDSMVEVGYIQALEGEPGSYASTMLFCGWPCFDAWVEKGRQVK